MASMNRRVFEELYEMAYDVRTTHERENGKWDKWYDGKHAGQRSFEKKPLQRCYSLFTKKGTFKRGEAYDGRNDMREAADDFFEFVEGQNEHSYNSAIGAAHRADQGAKKAAAAYINIQERMVIQPAKALERIRPLAKRLAKIFEPLLKDFEDREYTEANRLRLKREFSRIYKESESGDNSAHKLEDRIYVYVRDDLHNVNHNYPMYFLNEKWEDKFTEVWTAYDLQQEFLSKVDHLDTLTARARGRARDARDGTGGWGTVRDGIESAIEYLEDELLRRSETLARRTVSSSDKERQTLTDALRQVVDARTALRTALAVAQDESNGGDALYDAVDDARDTCMQKIRSARYKIHLVGEITFLQNWVWKRTRGNGSREVNEILGTD